MQSHDLARELLAHRNNDVQFTVEVSLPGRDDEDGEVCWVAMADDRLRSMGASEEEIPDASEVVRYDPADDVLRVQLGVVYAGKQGAVVLDPEDVPLVLEALRAFERNSPGAAGDLIDRIGEEAGL